MPSYKRSTRLVMVPRMLKTQQLTVRVGDLLKNPKVYLGTICIAGEDLYMRRELGGNTAGPTYLYVQEELADDEHLVE